jgi:hypothetical protein
MGKQYFDLFLDFFLTHIILSIGVTNLTRSKINMVCLMNRALIITVIWYMFYNSIIICTWRYLRGNLLISMFWPVEGQSIDQYVLSWPVFKAVGSSLQKFPVSVILETIHNQHSFSFSLFKGKYSAVELWSPLPKSERRSENVLHTMTRLFKFVAQWPRTCSPFKLMYPGAYIVLVYDEILFFIVQTHLITLIDGETRKTFSDEMRILGTKTSRRRD